MGVLFKLQLQRGYGPGSGVIVVTDAGLEVSGRKNYNGFTLHMSDCMARRAGASVCR